MVHPSPPSPFLTELTVIFDKRGEDLIPPSAVFPSLPPLRLSPRKLRLLVALQPAMRIARNCRRRLEEGPAETEDGKKRDNGSKVERERAKKNSPVPAGTQQLGPLTGSRVHMPPVSASFHLPPNSLRPLPTFDPLW